MNGKLLSIIVPSYNMEQYISRCLASLIVDAPLLHRFEVWVVNDGSTDKTSKLAHDFAHRYPGLFNVIDKSNGHYGSCINNALACASGTFVKVLDADDSFDTLNFKKWLLKVVEAADCGLLDEVDMLLTDFSTVDGQGKVLYKTNYFLKPGMKMTVASLPFHYKFQMHALAWRGEMLRKMNYHQTEGIMYTDTEWMIYPLMKARNYLYIPYSVYKYLVGRDGQSMDPQVFYKSMGQRISVYARMFQESHKEHWGDMGKRKLRYQSICGIMGLYQRFLGKEKIELDARFAAIEQSLREVDTAFYDEFNNVDYIRSWREKRVIPFRTVAMVRLIKAKEFFFAPVKQLIKNAYNKFHE